MTRRNPLESLKVSRETYQALTDLEAMVLRWNGAVNLVGTSTLRTIRERHVLDSAQLYALAPAAARHWVDLGSGGGFPGLVVAVIAQELRPALKMTLVEADLRKATFLREAARSLNLTATVHACRIEALPPQRADVLSARALAPLPLLLSYLERHMDTSGVALLPKGARHAEEVTAARQRWTFELETIASVSDPNAGVLVIRNSHRANHS